MAKPWPLAHRQTPGSTRPTWPSHANGRATQTLHCGRRKGSVGQPSRDHGAAWGPSCVPSPPTPQQGHSWQQSRGASKPPQPSSTSAEVPWGAWGTSPWGSWRWGSGRRAAHPSAGTRDILGKLRRSHFSECPSPAGSSIHFIWGLISLSHNHETVNTSLHPSESLMDT